VLVKGSPLRVLLLAVISSAVAPQKPKFLNHKKKS
jgi:hypothetical protein